MSGHSTFLFADIAGFTALTEAHGDEDAADLALEFCQRVRDRLAPSDGEVVKTIGDALMIRMAAAAGGQVLVSESVRHGAVAEGCRVSFVFSGEHRLRNVIEPVALYAAQRPTRPDGAAHAMDPVCHMAVVPGRGGPAGRARRRRYLFCSERCADRFAAAPESYVSPGGTRAG